jgi:hypothetical protein
MQVHIDIQRIIIGLLFCFCIVLFIVPASGQINYEDLSRIDYNNPLPIYQQIGASPGAVIIPPDPVIQKPLVMATPFIDPIIKQAIVLAVPTTPPAVATSSCNCNTDPNKYKKTGALPGRASEISKVIRYNFAPGITPEVDRVNREIAEAQRDGLLFPCLKFIYDPSITTKRTEVPGWPSLSKTDMPNTTDKWIMIFGEGANTASVPMGWVAINAIDSGVIGHEWSHVFAYWYRVTDMNHGGGGWDWRTGQYSIGQPVIDYLNENCPYNTVFTNGPIGNNANDFLIKMMYDRYYQPSICWGT